MKFSLSSKVYFRWLGIFVAMLGVAQMGWFVYFSIPRARPDRQTEMRSLTIPKLSSPTFRYRYRLEGEPASGSGWREVEIQEATGRKLLELLRGSKNLSLVMREAAREHPGSLVHFDSFPDSVGRLSAYEDGSDNPSLFVEFLGYYQVMVWRPGGKANTFFPSLEQAKEIKDAVDDIQWGPIPKDGV